ncbi:NAD(P)H-dependent oxidoreductase [uncultured Jatrophihabitans sp.]|uniref:NAD(P)H-dependent oxidoreductase n=1 Tax=uncultured Jatrophihabitans sp. TaxID=1610747 RepID=UPI0035C94A27
MTLFRLDASIRAEGSHSRAIADLVEAEWRQANPAARIVRRHVGTEPVPATAWAAAVSAAYVAQDERTPEQRAAVELARQETDALVAADAALFAVPLYNFGVSQHFKTWVDLIVTDPRMAAGATPATAGKPAVLATVRGGSYAAGTPREGWDHATSWMRRILEDVWQFELEVVEREFTLVGVNPALDQFTELADGLRAEAERVAREHGRALAGRLVA